MDPTSNYVIRLEQLGTLAEHSEKEFQFRWNLTAVDLSSGLLVAKGAGLGCGYQKQRLASSTTAYVTYYMESRTHQALQKDAPISRPVVPAAVGPIVVTPHIGGLHHRYDRVAA